MARAVARRGHEVTICATDRELAPGEGERLKSAAARDRVALRIFPQQAPRLLATSWPLARALDEAVPRADVVHLHSLYLFHVWATARACRRHGVPYLLRPHGTLDPFLWKRHRLRKWLIERAFQDRVIRRAAALHYTAAEELELAKPYVHGTPGVVIPNGLDLAEYADLPPPGGIRKSHPEIGDRRIVLFLGRLNFKKGLDLLVPAFAEACGAVDDLHLVIAGPDDGMGRRTETLVAAARVGDRVTILGMLDHARKLAAFRDAAMFVLPSYSENFGIAVVEAMACGLPVAISDKVNIWREVEEAGAGLVAPATVGAVAQQIIRLARDPDAAGMGARGRRLVEQRYAWDKIAQDLESVYRSLAATRPS
jgi:glycosyltransferase involved in cell wall biosynthesis